MSAVQQARGLQVAEEWQVACSLARSCADVWRRSDLSASQCDLRAISEEEAHSISMRSQCAIVSPSILSGAARAQRPRRHAVRKTDSRGVTCVPSADRDPGSYRPHRT